jgi:uroporphyrinogen-III decarboxylase
MSAADAAARHAERLQRVMDAVELRRPDRVPVGLHTMLWYAKYGGRTIRDVMYDYDLAAELGRRAIAEFEPDLFAPPHQFTALGRVLEAARFKQLQWPGHGVGDNQPYQYLDREYMKAEEYDEYLFDPTGFYLSKYMPRVLGVAEGLEGLPALPGFFYMRLVMGMRVFAQPRVVAAFQAMQQAGEEAERLVRRQIAFTREMESEGYVLGHGAVGIAPFDLVGDYMRGARGIMTDMFRRPEKLLAALDKAIPFILRQTIATCQASSSRIVFIPTHWAADNFMSPDKFRTFWWPSFRKVLLGLIEAGLIPMPMWEADCTKRLETIADIPRGKAIYWFERTDLATAKAVLGEIVCLRGNVPPSLMNTGSPAEVDACCRALIENVGRDGGLILDGAFGIPDEAPVENVRAMFAAARKYSG